MRLIDGDALIEKYNEKVDMAECLIDARTAQRFATFCALADAVEEMPTVDAVEVVRCRDCKYHYWEQEPCHGKSVHYCKLPHMRGVEVFKEFFCYYGERKEGAD